MNELTPFTIGVLIFILAVFSASIIWLIFKFIGFIEELRRWG